ncbi:DUF6622 family protein [Xenorhabdus griffiniae]|uniref:DUF6622 family protein n=1 Tax=Xenorhabdus griffiniae TaxID=351672 RepID=UPI0030D2796A
MSILAIIKGTPIWVWILFVFLIKRGINALYDREMRIDRLFFMPVLFLIWAIYSVLNETGHVFNPLICVKHRIHVQ